MLAHIMLTMLTTQVNSEPLVVVEPSPLMRELAKAAPPPIGEKEVLVETESPVSCVNTTFYVAMPHTEGHTLVSFFPSNTSNVLDIHLQDATLVKTSTDSERPTLMLQVVTHKMSVRFMPNTTVVESEHGGEVSLQVEVDDLTTLTIGPIFPGNLHRVVQHMHPSMLSPAMVHVAEGKRKPQLVLYPRYTPPPEVDLRPVRHAGIPWEAEDSAWGKPHEDIPQATISAMEFQDAIAFASVDIDPEKVLAEKIDCFNAEGAETNIAALPLSQ